MSKLIGLVELVQTAIDKGATSVEEVHQAIAKEPLDLLKKIAPLEKTAEKAQEFHEHTIGSIYEGIRSINQEVGKLATDLLEKVETFTTKEESSEQATEEKKEESSEKTTEAKKEESTEK
ncbi:MAG: hypothetical protein ACI86H_001320 [bacterium]|jgi:hypothetical protein